MSRGVGTWEVVLVRSWWKDDVSRGVGQVVLVRSWWEVVLAPIISEESVGSGGN